MAWSFDLLPNDNLSGGLGQGIPLDAWGNQKVSIGKSLYHGMFTFEVPQEYWKESLDGVELTSFNNAVSIDGELILTSALADESVVLDTFRNPRYQPNRGHHYAVSLFLPGPNLRGIRRFGTFTEEAGIFYELIGDGINHTLSLVSRTTIGGTTTDTSNLILDANKPTNYDPEMGNIYDIQAQMRMVGNFNAFIGSEITGVSEKVITVKNLNKLTNLAIFNPAFPLAFECINKGDEVQIKSGCVDLTSEGGDGVGGFYGSTSINNNNGQVSISGFNIPIMVVRNRKTVPVSGLRNTRDLVALLATAYSNQKSIFRIWATRDETAIALNDQSFQPFRDGIVEFVQYDNPDVATPMTFDTSKAELIFSSRVDQDSSYATSALFEGRTNIIHAPGDIFIFTVHRENGVNADVGVTYEFAEEV